MEKINLQGVPETMLQTLYARAAESQKENHCIYDEKAIEMVSRLDYDFSKASKDGMMSKGVIARTILLDRMVTEYLSQNPGAVVINIACGLDTRCYRMKGYSRWYNLDLPETISVRERFLPETDPIFQIGKSADDESWAEEVSHKGEPVLVIIEGLTMYLTQQQVQKIFRIIGENFPSAEVLMETMSPWVVGHVKEKSIEGSQAKFTWGVSDGKNLQALLPGFESVEDVSLAEGMKVFMPVYRFLSKLKIVSNISNKIMVLKHKG